MATNCHMPFTFAGYLLDSGDRNIWGALTPSGTYRLCSNE